MHKSNRGELKSSEPTPSANPSQSPSSSPSPTPSASPSPVADPVAHAGAQRKPVAKSIAQRKPVAKHAGACARAGNRCLVNGGAYVCPDGTDDVSCHPLPRAARCPCVV